MALSLDDGQDRADLPDGGGLRAGVQRDLRRRTGSDDTVVDAPFAWNPDVPLGALKIGYIKGDFETDAAGEHDRRGEEAVRGAAAHR